MPIQLANEAHSKVSLRLGPLAGRHPDRKDPHHPGAPAGVPAVETLSELLDHWARVQPGAAFAYFFDLDDTTTRLSWGELRERARTLACGLQDQGVVAGDRVLLALATSPELLCAFFACQMLGALPCIVEPPNLGRGFDRWYDRMKPKLGLLEARVLVSGATAVPVLRAALADAGPRVLAVEELPLDRPLTPFAGRGSDQAFLQFTSGTTSGARAVSCSQSAVLANLRGVGRCMCRFHAGDLMVSWLPLFHDMGLVATTLAAMGHGLPVAHMSPAAFVLQPARWLWAIHAMRATASFAPNFAYQLSASRIEEKALQGLDLSSWRTALNAAEFVHVQTVSRFVERFSPYGLPVDAMTPAYGMAEMVVGISSHEGGRPLQVDTISRPVLAAHGRAEAVEPGDPDGVRVASVGRVFPDHELRIVGQEGEALGDRVQGEITVRGPSLFSGYFRDGEATASAVQGGWLHTGDLGYLVDGRLFITGRTKDLIIRGGENHHPYVLEAVASEVPGVRAGRVAALGVPDASSGTENIFLLFETALEGAEDVKRMSLEIADRVQRLAGVRPDRVLAVPPYTIPLTTSGKIRRSLLRQQLIQGVLQ